jgi:hypothetical protein
VAAAGCRDRARRGRRARPEARSYHGERCRTT